MNIQRLDHLVLTVASIPDTVAFYTQVLGMNQEVFGEGRIALKFGEQKINLHQHGAEFEPKAFKVQPGSADLCFIVEPPLAAVIEHLRKRGVDILEGPVPRTGACGPIESVYLRDPDQNLIELACYS